MEEKFTANTLPENAKEALNKILNHCSSYDMEQRLEKIKNELEELHKDDFLYNDFYGAFDALNILKCFFTELRAAEKAILEAKEKETFEKKWSENGGFFKR